MSVLEDGSYFGEVPNSIRKEGQPYKQHPQFTIRILGNKITVWSDINQSTRPSKTGEE